MNSLNQQYEQKVRPCIDLIDSLRSLGVEKDLALPAIAVIGDQSSGKSSVLEALSGVALPRGSGENHQRIYLAFYFLFPFYFFMTNDEFPKDFSFVCVTTSKLFSSKKP